MSTKYELKNLATGKSTQLDSMSGTIGPDVLNISHLTRDMNVFTFDPGFMATASTESKVTYIDGDAGVLLYRGYPVEQLAERSSFLECHRPRRFNRRTLPTPWPISMICEHGAISTWPEEHGPWSWPNDVFLSMTPSRNTTDEPTSSIELWV